MGQETEQYVREHKFLLNERQPWESRWKDIANYLLPGRGIFDGYIPNFGGDKHSKVASGIPLQPIKNLAAMMHGGLTSPAKPWFKLTIGSDPRLNEVGQVKVWLEMVEKILYSTFNKSNFYDAAQSLYLEVSGFSTACMWVQPHPTNGIVCFPLTAGEYCIFNDANGQVGGIYREYYQTAYQLIEQWGDKVSRRVKEAYERGNMYKFFPVVHVLKRAAKESAMNKVYPYESVYYEKDSGEMLSKRFLDWFNYLATRWDTVGADVYGRGPGDDAIADIKQFYQVRTDEVRAVNKMIDPPMMAPSSFQDRLNLSSGAVNYVAKGDYEGVKPLYQLNINPQNAMVLESAIRESIEKIFFNDLFIFMVNNPYATATEMALRQEEKLLLMGPVINRQIHEFLDPVITLTFNMLNKQGKIPQPPELLMDQEIKVDYISMLVTAQKLVGAESIDRFINVVGAAANLAPQSLDKVDFDQMIDEYAEMTNVPVRVVVPDEFVAKIREQRAKQEQQQMMDQQAMQAAQTAKTLADAKTEGSVLQQLGG
jgi:hypothetical protein